MTRVMALWWPDWPVHAARLAGHAGHGETVIVTGRGSTLHRVRACCPAARAAGVRRGMRLREARALVADCVVAATDPDTEELLFEDIVSSLNGVTFSVEVCRPGLVVIPVDVPATYFGDEDTACQKLIDAASFPGLDVRAGIADEITTAIIAARTSSVVPPGKSRQFLQPVSVGILLDEQSFDIDVPTVKNLQSVGVNTFGALAAISETAVSTRFGKAGVDCHRIAAARTQRAVAPPLGPEPPTVTVIPEQPVTRVDEAAFIARGLAQKLHRKLAADNLVCQRLKVTVTTVSGQDTGICERYWRTREPLTEQAIADRVRWQLDGWITSRTTATGGKPGTSSRTDVGITSLTLEPLECAPPDAGDGLWSVSRGNGASARRVAARVQSSLGMDKVLAPVAVGGISPVEQVAYTTWGETADTTTAGMPAGAQAGKKTRNRTPAAGPQPEPPTGLVDVPAAADDSGAVTDLRQIPRQVVDVTDCADMPRWPGRIPGPHPARRGGQAGRPDGRVELFGAGGAPVTVSAEALLSCAPAVICWQDNRLPVTGWAGPWPVDSNWWTPHPVHAARLQITAQETGGGGAGHAPPKAWLLLWSGGWWCVEACYS
ncbi:Y-family DNA polymerase [Corynebacterium mendelii]|uniref:DNA polymerase Y family protein n=1 Tax=Corynebacterium mendelii TaxID=2765362 RepID=A0A939E092_9CORY|nr:DNA polymerase Y family protein [Corynebacterium mendelii]MBN9644069.1 DNA polymerase Y family protein [Corynebacterium mendelii]